ncbi:lipoyl synthase, partial [Shewanella sp. SG41-4]|uniref:lipoyl synthase n=1 Tax=Shewanella sp. SG41-4 TaxID=2760976 RepID=UPI00160372DE
MNRPERLQPGVKLRDADKVARIPVKVVPSERETMLRKPDWLRVKLPSSNQRILEIKAALRKNGLHSVCEEASCPNLAECFNHGTATFMILGAICTRRCPFCDVAHGRPLKADADEPKKLAQTIKDMKLKYVVITSVDRDDLSDGGAQHFADCIGEIRLLNPELKIETLVPAFRGRIDAALDILATEPPAVFNPTLETAPA